MEKSILKILFVAVLAEVLLTCLIVLFGDFSLATLAVYSVVLQVISMIFDFLVPSLFYSRIIDNKKYKNIAIFGFVFNFLLLIINIGRLLVKDFTISENIVITFNIIIWVTALISFIISFESNNKLLNLFKKISTTLLILSSLTIIFIIWILDFPTGFLLRLLAILIITAFGSYISTLILLKLNRNELIDISNTANDSNLNETKDKVVEIGQVLSNQENASIETNNIVNSQNISNINNPVNNIGNNQNASNTTNSVNINTTNNSN